MNIYVRVILFELMKGMIIMKNLIQGMVNILMTFANIFK